MWYVKYMFQGVYCTLVHRSGGLAGSGMVE